MKFETHCQKAIDILKATLIELDNISPEDDDEAEAISRMIVARTKKLEAVKEAYRTGEVSDLAKEVLRTYTGYKEEKEMNHIVVNKDVFESCCRRAIKNIFTEFEESDYTNTDLFLYSKIISDKIQEYRGHRSSIEGQIIDLIKNYSDKNWIGTEPVDIKLIEDSIKFIENQQEKLYDILKRYERGKDLTTAEYVTLQECQPFWGYTT